MSHQPRPGHHRAGPIFGVLLVMAGAVAALTPVVPGALAVDPTVPPDPSPTASPDPAASATPDPVLGPPPAPAAPAEPAPAAAPSPTPEPVGLRTTHTWIDTLDAGGIVVTAGALDTPLTGMDRGARYAIRFQVVNGTDLGVVIAPTLEIGTGVAPSAFPAVPAPTAVAGQPAFASAALEPGGAPATSVIAVPELRLATSLDPGATAVDGLISAGLNPVAALSLPPHTFTELSWIVEVTADAAWDEVYTLRLTDLGVPLAATATASAAMRAGTVIDPLAGLPVGAAAGEPLPAYPLALPPMSPPYTTPHFDMTLTGDSCAACHQSHTAQGTYLKALPAPTSNVCFQCHDGNGALVNVKAQYESPAPPANVPATGTWYSHAATTVTPHTLDREDEFSARLNRHSDCADCHQPHLADATLSSQTVSGWRSSGGIKGASGVSVVNGGAGTAPAYTWQPTTTYEYQLCFKCHSGFTQLTAGALDKGIELNPANGSTHPVEGPGTNQTPKMTISLNGASAYKLWAFPANGTVRCTQCHGDSRAVKTAIDARQTPHASGVEGILLAQYRRTLKPANQAYNRAEFALCLMCHGQAGLEGTNSATNFSDHQKHLAGLGGDGNAVCAECHYRPHSTALRRTDQTGSTNRLISFGPSVTPRNGVIRFSSTGPGSGSCTLTCHGKGHDAENYRP